MKRTDLEQVIRLCLMDGMITDGGYLNDKADIWLDNGFITKDMFNDIQTAIVEVCDTEWYKCQAQEKEALAALLEEEKKALHTEMADLAEKLFGNSMRFAIFCIQYNYDQTSIADIKDQLHKLKRERDGK